MKISIVSTFILVTLPVLSYGGDTIIVPAHNPSYVEGDSGMMHSDVNSRISKTVIKNVKGRGDKARTTNRDNVPMDDVSAIRRIKRLVNKVDDPTVVIIDSSVGGDSKVEVTESTPNLAPVSPLSSPVLPAKKGKEVLKEEKKVASHFPPSYTIGKSNSNLQCGQNNRTITVTCSGTSSQLKDSSYQDRVAEEISNAVR